MKSTRLSRNTAKSMRPSQPPPLEALEPRLALAQHLRLRPLPRSQPLRQQPRRLRRPQLRRHRLPRRTSTKGSMSIHKKPLVLAILDGWGYRAETRANAIALARKPVYDKLLAGFPNTLLHASDHFVGLPD